ncbi:DUF554 family protein [Erwinia tracheiphila]|uniref:DUF554 family protein n=1 Tax=Erwinia tracheiphila TaxID=65700 RepID=A0A345CP15_9GAMM|nr:DUF554 family protein [Erwinia tracheiphila]AXF75182.1 DUF554 family protein [Erwinia tracheiphila]UIA85743.1 DUF554 family protein [Erwinia tracheiphila]UIA94269.1 DUF554 family protein [Erwinia tracheiphila]
MILGVVLGELFYLERNIGKVGNLARGIAAKLAPDNGMDQRAFTEKFVAIVVLFCASGTEVIGAMLNREGLYFGAAPLLSLDWCGFIDSLFSCIFCLYVVFLLSQYTIRYTT